MLKGCPYVRFGTSLLHICQRNKGDGRECIREPAIERGWQILEWV